MQEAKALVRGPHTLPSQAHASQLPDRAAMWCRTLSSTWDASANVVMPLASSGESSPLPLCTASPWLLASSSCA